MQTHILERILFAAIVCTAVFAGLYLYTYLVSLCQSHWVSIHSSLIFSAGQTSFNLHGIV